MSDSSRVQVRYITETTWGTTPSSSLKNFRATSASLKQVNNTVISEELRSDGQVTDLIRVGVSATASLGFELSYGSIDDFLAGAMRQTAWTTDTGMSGALTGTDLLTNGTTARAFTVEAEFASITQFLTLTGCRVNSLSLSIQSGQTVTGTVELMGKIANVAASTSGTGSATAAPTADVMSSVNLSSVTEGGGAVELLGLNLTINNNLRLQNKLGTATTSLKGIGYGRFNVTGELSAYFADATLIDKYLDHTASDLAWIITDAAGNAYEFDVPRVRYADADTPVNGNDEDVILTMPFQAVYDSTTAKTLRVTRNPA